MIYPHSLQIQPECSEISGCWTNLRDAATQGKALKKLVE
jgi:hypothetical protein